jgi:hypothetical protein
MKHLLILIDRIIQINMLQNIKYNWYPTPPTNATEKFVQWNVSNTSLVITIDAVNEILTF